MTSALVESWLDAFGDVIQNAGYVLGNRWGRSVDAGVCPGDGMAGRLHSFCECQTFTANRITRSISGSYVLCRDLNRYSIVLATYCLRSTSDSSFAPPRHP
jgi:hypothetical protein